jgi:hypothetical protein
MRWNESKSAIMLRISSIDESIQSNNARCVFCYGFNAGEMAGNRMHNTYACMICLTIYRHWFSFHLCLKLIWSAGCIISHSRLLLLRIRIIFFLSSIIGSIVFKRNGFLILSILPTAWEICTCLNVISFWRTYIEY